MSTQVTATDDKSSTRKRLLDAALNVFAKQGYHDTSIDQIVEHAGTSKGAVYLYFPNKERLFLSLVDQFADLLEQRVEAAIAAYPHGIERVRAALVTVVETFGQYRKPAKILLVQAVGLGVTFEKKRLSVTDRFSKLIQSHLDDAVRVGDITAIDTEVVAHAWMGAIYNLMIQWVYAGEPTAERIVQTLVPILLKSVGFNDSAKGEQPRV